MRGQKHLAHTPNCGLYTNTNPPTHKHTHKKHFAAILSHVRCVFLAARFPKEQECATTTEKMRIFFFSFELNRRLGDKIIIVLSIIPLKVKEFPKWNSNSIREPHINHGRVYFHHTHTQIRYSNDLLFYFVANFFLQFLFIIWWFMFWTHAGWPRS